MSLCSFTVGQQPVASRPCRWRLMSQVLALQSRNQQLCQPPTTASRQCDSHNQAPTEKSCPKHTQGQQYEFSGTRLRMAPKAANHWEGTRQKVPQHSTRKLAARRMPWLTLRHSKNEGHAARSNGLIRQCVRLKCIGFPFGRDPDRRILGDTVARVEEVRRAESLGSKSRSAAQYRAPQARLRLPSTPYAIV